MSRLDQPEPSGSSVEVGLDPVRWRILFVLLVAIFMSLIGVSIVNVALPSIQRGLGADHSDMQWVLAGYALTFGVVLVPAGRAGDLVGRGAIFIVGVAIFTASSVAAGFAPDADWLNVARFAQGIGSGLLNPQGVGMIQQYFSGAERGRAFGYFGSTVGVSVALGPVLGGLLIDAGGLEIGWRLTFLVNVPVGVLTILLALLWFPRPLFRNAATRLATSGEDSSFWSSMDPVGAVLLGVAVMAILFPFAEAGPSVIVWLLFPVGLALVGGWVMWERRYARRGRSPMVDLRIFSTRSFSHGTVIVGLYFLGMTSVWVLVALYMQEGDDRSALESGLVGLPSSILSALAAQWAGRRVLHYGRKIVIAGLLLALTGLALSIATVLLHAGGHLSVWWLLLSLSFIGVAQGSVISPNQTLTLAEVPLRHAGSSAAIMQTGQRIGTSIGITVITAAAFGVLAVSSWAVAAATGFALIGLVVTVALGVAVKDQRERSRADTAATGA